jgi:hypothetical protein
MTDSVRHKEFDRTMAQNSQAKQFVRIVALAVFAAATIWIHYEVKVNVQGGGSGGSVKEMGNVKLSFVVLMLLLALWRFQKKEVC